MEHANSLVPFAYLQILGPALTKIDKSNPVAHSIQSKLKELEKNSPGLSLDLIVAILNKSQLNCNIHQSILRTNSTSELDGEPLKMVARGGESIKQLVRQLTTLKKILGRFPDQINGDRTTFLMTIKETAGTIKGILDTIIEVSIMLPNPSTKSLLDLQKMDFVKFSKRFSMTLQNYFRDGIEMQVYVSALSIVNQANVIILTLRQL